MEKNYIQNKFLKSPGTCKKNIFFIMLLALVSPSSFLAQQTYSFTNAGATNSVGPTQLQVNTAYFSTNLASAVTINTLGIQQWTVPYTGGFRIEADGAQGGVLWGLGARMIGDFTLTAGTVLKIIVGQAGGSIDNSHGSGGGGSYVAVNGATVPLVVAGGGGGRGASSGTNLQITSHGATVTAGQTPPGGGPGGVGGGGGAAGASTTGGTSTTPGGNSPSNVWASGGGGFYTNGGACNTGGVPGGRAYMSNSIGGDIAPTGGNTAGGFGGGGGCGDRGAGGGGYSGGGAGTSDSDGGGGGGSFNSGVNQVNTAGINSGHGKVIITELCFVSLTASTANSLAPAICSGSSVTLTTNAASNYTWSTGNTTSTVIVVSPTSTQTYSVIGTSTANCIAAGYITVTVSVGVPILSISNPSNNVCLGRTSTLTASGALTYTWTGGVTNGVSFTPPSGINNYTVAGQNGCGITTAVTSITVAPLPVTVAANPVIICAGSPSTLTATSAVNGYTWQPLGPTGSVVIVGPAATTVYTVTASDGTCSGVAMLTLTAKQIPTLTVLSSSSLVCQGAPVTLTASGAVSYSWVPTGQTGAIITASPSGPTLYQVTGTNALGCSASAAQAVLTNPSPTITITANKTTVCAGDAVTLLASGANNYDWAGGPLTPGYTVNPQVSTDYVVTGTLSGCSSSKTITINVLTASVSISSSTNSICNGGSANLTASGANTYTWVGFSSINPLNVTPNVTTTYTVNAHTTTITVAGLKCPSSNNITITVFNNPTVTIGSSTTKTIICKQDAAIILTGQGATNYTWTNNNATTPTISVHPQTNTTYNITGIDNNGCVSTGLRQVSVNNCTGIAGLTEAGNLISVYPNPSTGEFTVSCDTDINLKVINELGQEIRSIKLSQGNDHKVAVNNLANGIYFIVGENENGKVNQKIIVMK